MATKKKSIQKKSEACTPLLLRCFRLIDAFAKSNDERDFYLDGREGFILYVDLDKEEEDLDALDAAFAKDPERFLPIPKMTFYEAKKLMEGFVQEKVYDVDSKEKLLDIIQDKDARESFLDFLADHPTEEEKWQQYYQEKSRIRIIEWLREQGLEFVFEEDLDLSQGLLDKLRSTMFTEEAEREVAVARKLVDAKAKSYYSSEALNPRPKRGRPPKQAQKLDTEPQVSSDIYTQVPKGVRSFLYTPDITRVSTELFSTHFGHEEKKATSTTISTDLVQLEKKLASLRKLSSERMQKKK